MYVIAYKELLSFIGMVAPITGGIAAWQIYERQLWGTVLGGVFSVVPLLYLGAAVVLLHVGRRATTQKAISDRLAGMPFLLCLVATICWLAAIWIIAMIGYPEGANMVQSPPPS